MPSFTTGLADYGTQDSAFVTPFVGLAVGGVGLAHVPNVAMLIPSSGYSQQQSNGAEVAVIKDLVRKQV